MASIVKNKSCKLSDIAENAGLALSTVSRILNNNPGDYSSEETRQRVRLIAKKLGYRTNFGYRLMQGQKTNTVAIMMAEAYMESEEHISELLIRLMNKFDKLDYSVYFKTLTYSAEANLEKVRELISRGVEHFVSIGCPVGYLDIEKEIENSGRPLVGFSTKEMKRYIFSDSAAGVLAILRFFLNENRNFRMVCPVNHINIKNSRILALQRLFPELTFEQIVNRYIFATEVFDFKVKVNDFATAFSASGRDATSIILKTLPEVDALYFQNDYMAIGGANVLDSNGFEVGKDMLVAGFNNIPAVKLYKCPISSVEHDLESIVSLLTKESLIATPCQHIVEPIVHIRTK